jgi:DNA polymerase
VKLFVLDFETYYDNDYSLSKMSTEDYVADPRFDVIMAGIKIGNEPAYWAKGGVEILRERFDRIGLWDGCVIAHNMMFDGLVLQKHFGKLPKMLICTRFMAAPFFKPYTRSLSLDSCMKLTGLGVKGTTVNDMKGRTRQSLTSAEWAAYSSYCMNDCENEFKLFKHLASTLPVSELKIIDLTLRMYLQPRLLIDTNVMSEELAAVVARKEAQIAALPNGLGASDLSSNAKFAKILESYGIEVPMKRSITTGEAMPALAKNDPGFKELEEEYADDPVIGALLAARVGVKSTLEVSRYTRLLDIGLKHRWLRVPLLYYNAHTGRYGGAENINAQNFPRVDKSHMRFGVKAPKNHVVLAADLAQIEARMTAWLACALGLLQAFREKRDIYSEFATRVFRIETVKDRSPEDKARRFVGKTCILGLGYGMGADKLRDTLRKDGMIYDHVACQRMVTVYRETYQEIPMLWRRFDKALNDTVRSGGRVKIGPVSISSKCIVLPNGMSIQYPDLRYVLAGELSGKFRNYEGFVYRFAEEVRTLWGGKATENVVQALSRIVIMEHMLKIAHTLELNPVLQQHDELDYVVPKAHADEYAREITAIMRAPPEWAPDLPIDVEVNYGPTLGHCK